MVDVCGFHVGKYTLRPMAWYGRYRTFTLSTPPGRLPPGSSGRGQNQPSIIGGRRGGFYGDGFSCRKSLGKNVIFWKNRCTKLLAFLNFFRRLTGRGSCCFSGGVYSAATIIDICMIQIRVYAMVSTILLLCVFILLYYSFTLLCFYSIFLYSAILLLCYPLTLQFFSSTLLLLYHLLLSYYFTLLCFYSTILWLYFSFTLLYLDSAFPWLYFSFAPLIFYSIIIYSTILLLYYSTTLLFFLLYFSFTLLSFDSAISFAYRKFLNWTSFDYVYTICLIDIRYVRLVRCM